MSKVLAPQNTLPKQQYKNTENQKQTTPTLKVINNNNSNLNDNVAMRSTVSGSVASSSESPSTSSSPNTVDFDDFTSSSILEFLAKEQECCADADAESIFQEVSRLADNSDTRSVDEILREAELLIQQQSLLGSGDKALDAGQSMKQSANVMNKLKMPQSELQQQIQQPLKRMQSIKLNGKYTKRIDNFCGGQIQSHVPATPPRHRLFNGICSLQEIIQSNRERRMSGAVATSTDTTPTFTATTSPQTPTPMAATPNGTQRFDVFTDNLPSVSVISEESTPNDMQNMTAIEADVTTIALLVDDDDDGTDTMEEITEGIENIELLTNDQDSTSVGNNNNNNNNKNNTNAVNSTDLVRPDNFTNEIAVGVAVAAAVSVDADADADTDTLSATNSTTSSLVVGTAAAAGTPTNISNSSNSIFYVSSSSSVVTMSNDYMPNGHVAANVRTWRPSCDAATQLQPQHVAYASQSHTNTQLGDSPARRLPLTYSTSQFSSSSSLAERRSSSAGSSGVRHCSMITPDSGYSQTQSTQSCTLARYSPHPTTSMSSPAAAKMYCDKSVNSSPKHMVSTLTSPIEPFAANVGREHALKQEIEQLQEKLKDTEERLQSLRIQHDSLSQLHRDLRESNTKLQEESEMLKLDVQHLNECANILRTELQAARADRSEALELQKTLQSELDESRQDKKRAQMQKDNDVKTIQDLQRQCREMERILMRKHPDSVSALIVASKSAGKCANNDQENVNSRKLLEQRIAQLESDAKEQDLKAQQILANVQARFNSVQSKYETHIADLETQVLSLQEINAKLNEKIESQVRTLNYFVSKKAENYYNNCTQTDVNVAEFTNEAGCSGDVTKRASPYSAASVGSCTTGTQTADRRNMRDHSTNTIGTSSTVHSASSSTSSTANSTPNTSRPNSKQSGIRKPFTSAVGTLGTALASKLPISHSDTIISLHHAHAKEDAHLVATIRGMRVDLAIKDKAMQRLTRELEECKKTIKKLQREKEAAYKTEKIQWNSYNCLAASRRSHEAVHHNPPHTEQIPANMESQTLREAQNKIKLLESDYKILHDKRVSDLKTLQSAHERELATCHETVRVLQQRISEREEAFASHKRRKLPVDYYALKAKVSARHDMLDDYNGNQQHYNNAIESSDDEWVASASASANASARAGAAKMEKPMQKTKTYHMRLQPNATYSKNY